MEIIPALDLRAGQVVRLEQGDYARETVFERSPAKAAARFVRAGAPRLHVVDLDGAKAGAPANWAAVREILAEVGDVPVQLGGGIRSFTQIEEVLGLGLDRVVLGTAAIEDPELLTRAAERHPQRIVLGLDARDGQLSIRGWLETVALRVEDLLERVGALPLAAVLHTDIGRDGMLGGPALEATARLARLTRLPVLASGGIRSVDDLCALARTRVIAGAIVGRALYTGLLDLGEALRAVARC